MEDREAAADLGREVEQVELDTESPMVTLLGLLEPMEVILQRVGGLPGGAVDPLQHRVALVAAPVRARDSGELEVAEPSGVGHVRAAAHVAERGRVVVHAHEPRVGARGRVVGLAADDLELVLVRGEPLCRFRFSDLVANERLLLAR